MARVGPTGVPAPSPHLRETSRHRDQTRQPTDHFRKRKSPVTSRDHDHPALRRHTRRLAGHQQHHPQDATASCRLPGARVAISDIPTLAQQAVLKGPACTVCQALNGLDDTEAAALRGLLADPAWRYQELSDRLADEGYELAPFSLSRHARGRCQAREKLRGA